MAKTRQKAKSAGGRAWRYWAALFVASSFLSLPVLAPALHRGSDGDDAMTLYEAAFRSWKEVVTMTFVPPGHFEFSHFPNADDPPAARPLGLFDRWRPFNTYLLPKLIGSLDLRTPGYFYLNWFIYWLNCLGIAWGFVSLISLGIPLAPGAMWALACLYFWSAPSMFTATGPMYNNMVQLFTGIAFGLASVPGKGMQRWWRLSGAALAAFLAAQNHEVAWMLIFWAGVWLAGLEYFGLSKREGPRFWWPFAFLAFHVLVYRSVFRFGGAWAASNGGTTTAHGMVFGNLAYYALALVNGLTGSLPHMVGADNSTIDVALDPLPIAFLLTLASFVAAVVWAKRARGRPARPTQTDAKRERAWHLATVSLLAMAVISIGPFLLVNGHRFIHYVVVPSRFLMLWILIMVSQGKQVLRTPVVMFLIAGALTAGRITRHWNWIEMNSYNGRFFVYQALSHSDIRGCTSEKPCCTTMKRRHWGHNEFVIDWNLGAFLHPPLIPQGWGVTCDRTIEISD